MENAPHEKKIISQALVMARRITDHFYFMSERIEFLIDSIVDSFFNCFPPKNRPFWGGELRRPSRPTNKSRASSADDRTVAVQSC
jgi:hypothetical protein